MFIHLCIPKVNVYCYMKLHISKVFTTKCVTMIYLIGDTRRILEIINTALEMSWNYVIMKGIQYECFFFVYVCSTFLNMLILK